MSVSFRAVQNGALIAVIAGIAIVAGCGPGNNSAPVVVSPGGGSSTTTTTTASFATIAGPPTTLTSSSQAVTLPAVAGVSNVGGNVMMSASAGGTALVTVASVSATTGGGGPPVGLASIGRRGAQDFNGTTITPQYYVGVTNTGTGPTTVNIPTLNLNVNVGSGQTVGLAHYDPTQPQNGWNQHCAVGNGQVTNNGNGTTTFNPGGNGNATFTIYPGATLWFAPYLYPSSSTATPSPAPQASGVVPTPAPAPASLTGTYIGSGQQTAPNSQASQYLEFSLTQSGSNLSGTFAILPSSNGQNGGFGSLSGTVSNGVVKLTASQTYGNTCTTALNGTASGMLISGTFASTGGSGNNTCNGTGNFSGVLQTASLPTVSGNYSGTINDSSNGAGTITFNVSSPGTVFSGTGTVNWPSNPQAGGSNAVVGFVTSATSGFFAVIGTGNDNCSPNGQLTLSNSGATITAQFAGSGSPTGNSCSGTGSFTMSH